MDMQGRRGAASQRSTTVNHGAQRPTRSAARQPQPAVIRPQVRIYGMQGVKAWIGLAVPGRPIDPWSRRTGAPQASATRRDRNPDAHAIAHGTRRDTPGRADTGWDDVAASAQLEGLAEARAGPLRTARAQFRSRWGNPWGFESPRSHDGWRWAAPAAGQGRGQQARGSQEGRPRVARVGLGGFGGGGLGTTTLPARRLKSAPRTRTTA
jgi:hypothetical protein